MPKKGPPSDPETSFHEQTYASIFRRPGYPRQTLPRGSMGLGFRVYTLFMELGPKKTIPILVLGT